MGIFWGVPQPTEAHSSRFTVSKLRFRLRLRLHGVVHDTPSPMAGLRLACEAGGSEAGVAASAGQVLGYLVRR